MNKVIYYDFVEECYYHNCKEYWLDVRDYPYVVTEDFDDIYQYKFETKYGRKYDDRNWLLEKDSLEFYHELENQYLRNEIDSYSLYNQDDDFYTFLYNKYRDSALERAIIECGEEINEYEVY